MLRDDHDQSHNRSALYTVDDLLLMLTVLIGCTDWVVTMDNVCDTTHIIKDKFCIPYWTQRLQRERRERERTTIAYLYTLH